MVSIFDENYSTASCKWKKKCFGIFRHFGNGQYTSFTLDRYIILACIFGCRQGDIDHEYTRFPLITSTIVHRAPALTFSRPVEYQSDKQWLFFIHTKICSP